MAYFQKRSGSWRAIVKKKGYDRITRTFDTKTEAEFWARQIEAEMDRGVFFYRKEAESTTLSEALDRYEREVSSTKKGYFQEKSGSGLGDPILWEDGFLPRSREKISPNTGTNGSNPESRPTPSDWISL